MKNKLLVALIAAIIIFNPYNAYAQEKSSIPSATINTLEPTREGKDNRAKILQEYLDSQNSPLAQYAADFVLYADRYNLDWKLVAAISGVESTFGKQIPPYSYNGWGWGVYGDNVIRFSSWTEGIQTVSEGLRKKYMNQWGAQDIYQIGAMYASSQFWAGHVISMVNRIEDFAVNRASDNLSLSL